MSNTKDISAIYSITNLVNGKFYIGSAAFYASRKRTHLAWFRKGKHQNIYMQRAFDKYGESSFEFKVLEIVEKKEDLLQKEQIWMDALKPDYNICKTAGSILGIRFSEESKKRLSEMRKGEKNIHYGKPMPNSIKEKLRAKALERMTDERKLMHRNVHKIRMKPVVQLSLKGESLAEFECINDAVKATKVNKSQIQYCCKGGYQNRRYETAGGFKWKYKT